MIDITPETYLLESQQNQGHQWKTILGELIDNSFGAKANQVRIAFEGKKLTITDDGCGCDDLTVFFKIGKRRKNSDDELGFYGIGAKEAFLSAADCVEVRSIVGNREQILSCDWRDVQRSGRWCLDDPTIQKVDGEPSGTNIVLSSLRMRQPANFSSLIDTISLMYSPAIKAGRQILLKPTASKPFAPIPEFQRPILEDSIPEVHLDLDGKTATLNLGIVPRGAKFALRGMMVSFRYRVIESQTQLGLGSDAAPGVFGWVELHSGWKLTKNKSSIIGSQRDELSDAIWQHSRPVVEKAKASTRDLNLSKIANRLTLNWHTANVNQKQKAKRHKGESTGTVEPTFSGRKHRRAAKEQTGDNWIKKAVSKGRNLQISFEHMTADGPIARCSDTVLYLNADHPTIHADCGNDPAIYRHAVYAFAGWLSLSDHRQQLLGFPGDDDFTRFANVVSALLTEVPETELRVVQESA